MQLVGQLYQGIIQQPRRYQAQLLMALDILGLAALSIPFVLITRSSGIGGVLNASPWLSGGLVAALLGAALLMRDDPNLGLASAALKVVGYTAAISGAMELLGNLQANVHQEHLTTSALFIAFAVIFTDHLFQGLIYLGYLGSPRADQTAQRSGVAGWLQRRQGNRPRRCPVCLAAVATPGCSGPGGGDRWPAGAHPGRVCLSLAG